MTSPPSRDRFKYCPRCRTELIDTEINGHDRQICPDTGCGFIAWNNPIPIVAAIVEHDEHIVLVRSHGWPDTWYGLVAGFLEAGERPEEGVLREVEEEIGIAVRNPSFVGFHSFRERNQIIFTYHIEIPHIEIRLCERELADYRIVPMAELKTWPRGTGPALHDWLVGRGYQPETVDFGRHLTD